MLVKVSWIHEPRQGVLLGTVRYGDGVKGFRSYSPSEGRVILSRDVTFDESTMYSKKSTKTSDLWKKGEILLQTDEVLMVHQLPLLI